MSLCAPSTPLRGVALRNVCFAYADAHLALRDVSMEIGPGEFVAIVGHNGAGKTTLAKHLNGLLLPTHGLVLVDGQPTGDLSSSQLARSVGYVFQNPDHQIFAASVREELAFGPRNIGLPEAKVAHRVEETLRRFGLTEAADVPPALLGFAWRRKVAIASVYAMRPKTLLLDEPTGGLDWESVQELMAVLTDLHAEGHSIVIITHDMALVSRHAQRVLVMDNGALVADQSPADLLTDPGAAMGSDILPPVTRLARGLTDCGVRANAVTVDDFVRVYASLTLTGVDLAGGSE